MSSPMVITTTSQRQNYFFIIITIIIVVIIIISVIIIVIIITIISKWYKCHQMGYEQQLTCPFCDQQQTLDHVFGECETALLDSRYNWRHDPILLNIYKKIKSQGLQAFVDIKDYPNPSIITGDDQRPDVAIVKN